MGQWRRPAVDHSHATVAELDRAVVVAHELAAAARVAVSLEIVLRRAISLPFCFELTAQKRADLRGLYMSRNGTHVQSLDNTKQRYINGKI
jgi:hypothetical protein